MLSYHHHHHHHIKFSRKFKAFPEVLDFMCANVQKWRPEIFWYLIAKVLYCLRKTCGLSKNQSNHKTICLVWVNLHNGLYLNKKYIQNIAQHYEFYLSSIYIISKILFLVFLQVFYNTFFKILGSFGGLEKVCLWINSNNSMHNRICENGGRFHAA